MSAVDWDAVMAKLPTEKTEEEKAKRMELFAQFDPNGNGYLSLAEVDKGIRDVLELEGVFSCKPVIMRAFQSAKSANDAKGKPSPHGPDYVEKCEFRLLLVYLRQYFELWQMFDAVDTSNDRRVDATEFKTAIPLMETWGVTIEDPDSAFAEMDQNGGGKILFDEFAHWAIGKSLGNVDRDE